MYYTCTIKGYVTVLFYHPYLVSQQVDTQAIVIKHEWLISMLELKFAT